MRGYVGGYNRYLADTGVDNLSDPRCRGKDWARPISELDAYRRFYQLGILAGQGVAIDGIARAQPPPPGDTGAGAPPGRASLLELGDRLKLDIGSNAYGLGREAVAGGGGMVLGNPHFPWDGPERFFQAQLTIPGKVDVAGASLFGVPVVLIGSTRNLAWSHTVSTAFRFTPFEVKLVPGSPTTYLVDGQPHQMERDVVTVDVGGGQQRTRTLYSTQYGPVFTSLLGLPLFPWTSASAYSMGDVNGGNFRYLNHFFETNQAQSVEQYDTIERRYQGIPWVNSIAADSSGKAYYADIGAIPNVSDDKARICGTPLGLATFQAIRLPVLDGSRSSCDWDDDPDAAVPGIFGPSHEPSLFRDDYVTNSNDSYWLSNPEQPLEGFARIIGDERTARSLRTRLGLKLVEAGRPFTLRRLQDAVFNNRQYAGELWRDQLVDMCGQTPGAEEACPALRAWDLHDDLDSRGAILFRRFAGRALAVAGGPYSTPFDADDPVNTPRGLNTFHPQVRQALLDAIQDLRDSGIPTGRAAARMAVRAAGRRANPDPRRPRHRGRLQRDQRHVREGPGLPGRAARLELRPGRAPHGRLPRRADNPHLLSVDQPQLALLRRPDAHVLAQGVGRLPVLLEGRPRGDGRHHPPALAGARAARVRAGGGRRLGRSAPPLLRLARSASRGQDPATAASLWPGASMVTAPDWVLLNGSRSILWRVGVEKRTPSPKSTGRT